MITRLKSSAQTLLFCAAALIGIWLIDTLLGGVE